MANPEYLNYAAPLPRVPEPTARIRWMLTGSATRVLQQQWIGASGHVEWRVVEEVEAGE